MVPSALIAIVPCEYDRSAWSFTVLRLKTATVVMSSVASSSTPDVARSFIRRSRRIHRS